MINKKADITAKQIITIIILIVSFSIILIFFFSLNIEETIDQETCRNSVAFKGLVPKLFGNMVSLRCKTQDVCISAGGDCEGLSSDAVIIDIDLNSVSSSTDKDKLIYDALLGLQHNCFWMMGEGKINIGKKTCAICNIITFDSIMQQEFPTIKKEEYFKYLQDSAVPNEDYSYLYYFYEKPYWETLKTVWQAQNRKIEDIETDKKYMTYYFYSEANKWMIDIEPFDSQYLKKLGCEDFATLT